MITENPQVARLGSCLVGRLGNLVGIGQAVLHARVEELGQFVLVETQQAEVEVARLQVCQFDRQQVVIPVGNGGGLVVRDPIGLDLFGRQVPCDVNRHLLQAQLQGSLVAGVADDDHALGVHHDRLSEPKFLYRRRHGVDGRVVLAGVARVGLDV